MLPFAFVWLLAAACINAYHSELILDEATGEVSYRTSLLLHSWTNKVARGNVRRVTLSAEGSRYRFTMDVEKGEDLVVTTFDYWRSREWSEQVARFLDVPLVDECRDHEVSPEELGHSIRDKYRGVDPPGSAPGKIAAEWVHENRATIAIPPRGLLPSARPRIALGTVSLAVGVAGAVLWSPWLLAPAFFLSLVAWMRPFTQATHREEIEVSPNGVLVTVTTLGRSKKTSLSIRDIRDINLVKGEDVRFEHDEFDRHAVCLEGPSGHLQLGSHLPKLEQAEWLRQTLLFVLCSRSK
jgi:hypothetical protein